ncbi:subtilisin-like protein [Coprinopsis marcescibilis]|uniref:Subtilisin-like protein n=1 Tax=Coprinopsis marcescibilis TaxID=230819 RepID=A0A5C3L8U2_COPMA|nr:subtilisin-like protein [Coprinopsis marcescibilis]
MLQLRANIDDDDDDGLDLNEPVKRGALSDPVIEAYRNLKRASSPAELDNLRHLAASITHLEKQHRHTFVPRAPAPEAAPPLYPDNLMNVTPVWDMGYTGKGIVTAIIDDGVDYTSEDLKVNFDAKNSYDFNDHEPMSFFKRRTDHHGTRCAGQIAAAKNGLCGVFGGQITAVDEAAPLNYGFQDVSIYSCSRGPRDNGTKMQVPPYIIRKAVLSGANKERGGKGSLFVSASGNGTHKGISTGIRTVYGASLWVLWITRGYIPSTRRCAANLVVGYSSGRGDHITTTDKGVRECAHSLMVARLLQQPALQGDCACPGSPTRLVLARHAVPRRQHRPAHQPPRPRLGTHTFRQILQLKYGYGVMDAWRFVTAAKEWQLVEPQAYIELNPNILNNGELKAIWKGKGWSMSRLGFGLTIAGGETSKLSWCCLLGEEPVGGDEGTGGKGIGQRLGSRGGRL